MPDGNGLDFAGWVRKRSDVYIIFLTALDQEVDIVNGYDVGADDYITKPFSLLVLISKVHALMRRMDQKSEMIMQTEPEICSGNIRVQRAQMKVYHGEEELSLSKKELQLLCYFLEHPGQIISKEQILEAVWDIDGQFVDDNTVPVTISRLKKRLADVLEWKNLTVEGGYKNAPVQVEEMFAWLEKYGTFFASFVCNTTEYLSDAMNDGKSIIFEAQLGALRDIDFGIYPYTSASTTLAAYAPILSLIHI